MASEADALRYAADRLASNNWVSLGGWGGRIVAAFAEPVPNTGGYDLYVKGNQFDTSSEPGIVWVSQDANGDGAPNDTWYELRGSEYDNAETIRGYKITYTRPAEADAPVAWSDNAGGSGTIDRVKEHTQAYYPRMARGSDSHSKGHGCRTISEKPGKNGRWSLLHGVTPTTIRPPTAPA